MSLLTNPLSDTFLRVEASGLGVADSGHTYTITGTGSTSVDGERAMFSLPTAGAPLSATLSDVADSNVDFVASFRMDSLPDGASLVMQLQARVASSSSFTMGTVAAAPNGSTTLQISEGGSTILSQAGPAWTGNDVINMHFRLVGTSVRLKVWYGEDPEPSNWNVSIIHTSVNASGTIAVRVYCGGTTNPAALPFTVGLDSLVAGVAEQGASLVDTFTRTVSNGLSTSDSDHPWTITTGTPSKISVDGDEAVFGLTNDNEIQLLTTGVNLTDFRAKWDTKVATSPTTATTQSAFVRYQDASNYLIAGIQFLTDGTASLFITKVVAGVLSSVGSSALGAYSSGQYWSVTVETTAGIVKAKAWVTSGTEPASWILDIADPDVISSGVAALRVHRAATGTAGPHNVYIDNLNVRDVTPGISVVLVENADSPGVQITLNNGDVYHAMRVERLHLENKIPVQAVRGLDVVPIPSAVNSVVDYEMPLDETFIYQAVALNTNLEEISLAQSDPIIVEAPYHRVIIRSVGQPTLSRRVQITEFPSFNQSLRILQEAKVLGRSRPVILFDVLEGLTGSFEFMNVLDASPMGTDIRELINEGQPLLFQSVSRVTGIDDFYFVVNSVSINLKTKVHPTDLPRYTFSVDFTEIDRPPTDSESLGFFDWQTLIDVGHVSWQSVDDTFTSWLSVLNFAGRDPL